MNAIEILTNDHRAASEILDRLMMGQDVDYAELVGQVRRLLLVHARMEERVLYPAVDEDFPELRTEVRDHLQEHEELHSALDELADLSPDDEEFDQMLEDLRALMSHHVEEEEAELFPALRERWDAARLERVGRALEYVREEARAITQ